MTAGACAPVVDGASDRRLRLLIAAFALTSTVGYIAMIQVLPVVLIPIADELGQSRTAIAAASTISTLMGALAAFPIGRLFDRHGGRMLMAGGSALGAAAVLLWSQAASLAVLYIAFTLIGVSIALTTYEAAFAVLVVVAEPLQRPGDPDCHHDRRAGHLSRLSRSRLDEQRIGLAHHLGRSGSRAGRDVGAHTSVIWGSFGVFIAVPC